MSELTGQVRAAMAERMGGKPDRMGHFTAPFRPAMGPLSGSVLKPFRAGRDPELLEQLARRHEIYLDCLTRAGLTLPATRLLLMHQNGVLQPVVVQDAVPRDAILARLLTDATLPDALAFLEEAARAVCGFWAGVAQRAERIGLHAGVHSFAFDAEAGPVFLETCPPLIGYSREEMGRLLLRFSESGLIRGVGAILPGRLREIQDPWYTLPGNLGLLVEGGLRLRPQDAAEILDWTESFAASRLGSSDRSALLTGLARPRLRLGPARRGRWRRFGLNLRPHA
jgi:hypothetical protein